MPQIVGLRCPHCAAALPAEAGATSLKCSYCGTTSVLQRGGTVVPAQTTGAPPSGRSSMGLVGCAGVILLLSVGAGVMMFLFRSSPPSQAVVAQTVTTPAVPIPVIDRPAPISEPDPVRTVLRIDTGRRPLLVDVDGDDHPDILALTDFAEGDRRWSAYAAHASTTGEVLWTVDVADADVRNIHAAVAHGRLLLLNESGQVTGHDLATGAPQWSTALGERGKQMCASKTADAIDITTLDDRVLQLDTKTGKQTPVTARTCTALPTDHEPTLQDPGDRTDTRGPAGSLALRCGGVSVYTSSGLSKLPDQCRQRSKVAVDDLPGLVVHSLWQAGDGWLVLGVRSPGTYVPTVGFVDKQRKLAWKADVPAGNPLLADQGGPDPAVLLEDRVIVGYTAKDQAPHLTSFNLADGARQWHIDVPGGKRVQRAAAADDHVFLYADGSVYILNPADGALVRTIGKS